MKVIFMLKKQLFLFKHGFFENISKFDTQLLKLGKLKLE